MAPNTDQKTNLDVPCGLPRPSSLITALYSFAETGSAPGCIAPNVHGLARD
jgi:hypothetical protein